MNLELVGHDHRYAVEQMALMLLGQEMAQGGGPEWGKVTLEGDWAEGLFQFPGGLCRGEARREELGIDTPKDQKAVEQRLVKLAAYRALIQHTGTQPWGALSGVRPAKLVTKWLHSGATPLEVVNTLTGLYGVDRSKATLTVRCAQESLAVEEELEERDLSLYVGIPFCPSRCAYCSFISADVKGALALVGPYVRALEEEMDWAGELVGRRKLRVRSVYMGGGTPTTLTAEQLDSLLGRLDRWLDREALAEFTVEAGRPDTITPEKLAVLRAHGVDRVSVNPQTTSDAVLETIGRKHTAGQFFDAYGLAREAGFSAINTDLIAGLPGDSPEGFSKTLADILELRPEEITLHTLALKHGSNLIAAPQDYPGAAAVTEMLALAGREFSLAGYRPYYLYRQKYMTGSLENVGWTRRERGSFYNVVMMEELHTVLALGAGSVTKLVDRGRNIILRHANPKYPKEYLERLPQAMAAREALPWPD